MNRILLLAVIGAFAPAWTFAAENLLSLDACLPSEATDFTAVNNERLTRVAKAIEDWAGDLVWNNGARSPTRVRDDLEQLVLAKRRVDQGLAQVLAVRTAFAGLPESADRKETIRQYLRTTARLIELSGRLRFLLNDGVGDAARRLDANLTDFAGFLDLLRKYRVNAGPATLGYVLIDPPPASGLRPYPRAIREKLLDLIEATRNYESLPTLVQFVRQSTTPPDQAIRAAEIIRELGLPQDPFPGQDPTLPAPEITAEKLREVLSRVRVPRTDPLLDRRRINLFAWLNRRMLNGVEEESFRIGDFEVRAGDWLLMRNPSPYNLFTDLSPGLFTHVGVVAVTKEPDGKRRFLLVDLPERGDKVPATNVEVFLLRTLHYAFLRHEQPDVAAKLGEVAATVINNPSQFDLNFRTDRLRNLKGKPLRGETIHTYCAGLLLLCAQETSAPRDEFFPIAESPAGNHCPENLTQLGMSLGQDFVSPTGALFSPSLQLTGRREPMYTPSREIEEAIYDHFADGMINKVLTPSPDAVQLLRQKVAGLAKFNPWLATALAKANNVNAKLDLEAAAKAAAVVETLDEIAQSNSRTYFTAFDAMLNRPAADLKREGVSEQQIEQFGQLRKEHAELFREWSGEKINARELRERLVNHYSTLGKQQLDRRFFAKP